jgi:pimeloyl-ACP methyl ester carboxylesterase
MMTDCPFGRLSLAALLLAGVFPFLLPGSQVNSGSGDPQPQDIAFTAQCDGTEQRYVLLLPRGFEAGRAHDMLIALHGLLSDRWQFVRPERDEPRAVLDVAARHNLILVTPEYRLTSPMGATAEADVTQIIGEMKARYRIGKVFICGASLGGGSSLTYAVLHPDLIDGVASMNGRANYLEPGPKPVYDTEAVAAAVAAVRRWPVFGGTVQQTPLEYKMRSAEYWPERLLGMPVAFTASGQDTSVPPQSVLRLAAVLENLGGRVKMIYREKVGHVTGYADAVEALEFVISSAAGGAAPGRQE